MELESLSKKELEDIYVECLLKEKIIINAKNLNHKIDEYIQKYMKDRIENKCINEGFIKEDSLNIINKSVGAIKNSRFYGEVSYDILYKAQICNPVVGNVIDCKVKFVNKLGLLGNNGPLVIIVGKQFHKNSNILDKINVDDIVKVEVIAKKFSLNDKDIKIIAKLYNVNENEVNENIIDDKKDFTLGDIDDDDKSVDKNDTIYNDDSMKEIDDDFIDEDDLDEDDFEDDFEDDDMEDDEEDEEDKELIIDGLQDNEINDDDLPEDEQTLDDDDDF